MKIKIAALTVSLLHLPFALYLTYLMLQKIGATDLMWFLYWLTIPMAFALAVLTKLAEWEED